MFKVSPSLTLLPDKAQAYVIDVVKTILVNFLIFNFRGINVLNNKTELEKAFAKHKKSLDEKRKEKESKKKKNNTKKEERRTLKKIGLKKAPSQLVLAQVIIDVAIFVKSQFETLKKGAILTCSSSQVKCIWLAVDLALEDCGKNILKASKIGHD